MVEESLKAIDLILTPGCNHRGFQRAVERLAVQCPILHLTSFRRVISSSHFSTASRSHTSDVLMRQGAGS
jgi:hypothetical protein